MGVLTALYFAVIGDLQDKPASLWALHPVKLNRIMTENPAKGVLHHHESETQELINIAFQRYSERPDLGDRVLAMSGPELDLRILVQWGVFTIHASNTPIEQLPNYRDYAAEISIPTQDRHPLRQALLIAGFSRSRLFPDLQSLAEDLRNKYRY